MLSAEAPGPCWPLLAPLEGPRAVLGVGWLRVKAKATLPSHLRDFHLLPTGHRVTVPIRQVKALRPGATEGGDRRGPELA